MPGKNIPACVEDKTAWWKLHAAVRKLTINIFRKLSQKYKVDYIRINGRGKVQLKLSTEKTDSAFIDIRRRTTKKGRVKYFSTSFFDGGPGTLILVENRDIVRLEIIFNSALEHL